MNTRSKKFRLTQYKRFVPYGTHPNSAFGRNSFMLGALYPLKTERVVQKISKKIFGELTKSLFFSLKITFQKNYELAEMVISMFWKTLKKIFGGENCDIGQNKALKKQPSSRKVALEYNTLSGYG